MGKEMDGEPWQRAEWAEWAEQARQLGEGGREALRARMRRELNEAGQEVARLAMALARDTYRACRNPVAWGPEPTLTAERDHQGRVITLYTSSVLMETFWKMQLPVLSVRYGLRFFAWDHAVSQEQSVDNQGNQEADDDGHE